MKWKKISIFWQATSSSTHIILYLGNSMQQPQLSKIQPRLGPAVRSGIFITIGVLSAGLGLKGFLLPSHFLDGGVTGISLLLNKLTGWDIALLICVVNAPFIAMGYFQVGRNFAVKTALAIVGLSLCLLLIPYPVATTDKLLIAVFGGFFLGCGIGLAMRGGAVIDGTEVLALFISRKTSMTIGDVIFLLNVLIFSTAALLLTLETAFYAMLTYLSASRTVDFIIEGIEEYVGVTIISHQYSDPIRVAIIEKIGRGVTIYRGAGGYGKRGDAQKDIDIVFTVVTRLELSKLQQEIDLIDPDAFVIQHSINDTKGGMIKKRPLH